MVTAGLGLFSGQIAPIAEGGRTAVHDQIVREIQGKFYALGSETESFVFNILQLPVTEADWKLHLTEKRLRGKHK